MKEPIGREVQREVIATFIAAAVDGAAVLDIEGEAGIGKTTLVRFAIHSARLAGSRVLSCGLTEPESELSFAGLTDLLRDVDFEGVEGLPVPQREALAVATLRMASTEGAVDERTIGTGLATLLSILAEQNALIIAVDDAQWLDRASADVVGFALHRLGGRPLGLLTSRRTGTAATGLTVTGLTATLNEPEWQRSIALAGLTAAAVFHVVRSQQGISLTRPTLLRITDVARGNPFVALELARASTSSREGSTAESLPLTENLQLLVRDRLATLSDTARRALLAVACAGRPTLTMLTGLGTRQGVEEAEAAHIVAIDDGRVVFDHPLLSAAVLQAATGPERREVHHMLGAVSTDIEASARHFALANPEPDSATSIALDDAAASAEGRGATGAAADLARLALDRTIPTDVDAVWRRRVRLAHLLHTAGSGIEAGEVLVDLDTSCPPGPLAAQAHLLMAEVAYQTTTTERAFAHARSACAHAGEDLVLRARALLSLAALSIDGAEIGRYADAARDCAQRAEDADSALLAWSAIAQISARFASGEGLDRGALNEALLLERTGRQWRSGDQVAAIRPILLKWADDPEEALRSLEELRDRAVMEGNEGLLPYITGHEPGVLLRIGRFPEAAEAAAEHLALALATGQDGQRVQALYNVGLVDAHLGNLEDATSIGSEILAWSDANSDRWMEMSACAVLGLSCLTGGDLQNARIWFDRWWTCAEAEKLIDPGISRFHGDHIEALVGVGAIDEAGFQTDILEARATRAERVSAAAVAARCRALLAATGGRQAEALVHLDRALQLHEQCPIEFELARTMLTKGVIHRRAKEKRAARECLIDAQARFVELGASGFAVRAAAELDRVGTRVTVTLELTATERRIAELAASGLTNRQVGERSFMSPKTVEANLARVYRKLGIASRAELGALMSQHRKSE